MTEAEKAVIEAFVSGKDQQVAADAVNTLCRERVGEKIIKKLAAICGEYSTAVQVEADVAGVKVDWLANEVARRVFEEQKAAAEAKKAAEQPEVAQA